MRSVITFHLWIDQVLLRTMLGVFTYPFMRIIRIHALSVQIEYMPTS